jgi:hypothetical protein
MSLQKKNNLVRAHLAILVFWFIVLFLAARGVNLKLLASSMTYAMVIMGGGVVIGVMLWVTFDLLRRDSVLERNGSHSVRGASVSIGDPPSPTQVPRGKVSASMLASRFPWWGAYSKRYPKHAEAFLAVFAVMYANPRLPASPVPGGHGGATLIDHSFNVVKTMMEMAPKWSYRGHRNKRGEVSFPLLDNTKSEFRFTPDDPILPLTAFAHDIGKTACYKMDPDGYVREVRKNHDIEGAKIMRTLPEVMALPWKDRMAVLTACEYYHHIGSLPYSTWIDDRARALIELLIAADIETGKREGGVVTNEYQDGDFVLPQPNSSQAQTAEDDGHESGESPSDDGGLTMASENRHPPVGAPASGSDEHGSALDLAYSVLLEPGRVNGTNAANRIAWKHGEWLYISDAKLRAAVAKMTGDSGYNTLPHRGNMHAFTLELMSQLAASGNLLQEHDGQKFSEKRALFTTRSAVPGKTPVENKFVLVANVRAFPGLENAADCKAAPQVVGCSWGENAAINKSSLNQVESTKADEGEADSGGAAEVLLAAAAEMRIPFVERSVDGEDFLFFEEEIVRQEFPDLDLSDEQIIKKSGAKSGKCFIGIGARKQA